MSEKCGPLRSKAWIQRHQPTCGVCGAGLFGRDARWVPGCAHHEGEGYTEQPGFWACVGYGCDAAVEAYTHRRKPIASDYEARSADQSRGDRE